MHRSFHQHGGDPRVPRREGHVITIVTAGGGRCGTSLCMQMLQAAGVPLFWNRLPNRTTINPFGHYEIQKAKRHESSYIQNVLEQVEGKAIKLFASKLKHVRQHTCRFIEMRRDPECMRDSQKVMWREEKRKAKFDDKISSVSKSQDWLAKWLQGENHITVHFYELFNGKGPARIAEFLSLTDPLAVAKMMECVEPSLWHFKPGIKTDPRTVYANVEEK